MSVKKSIFVSTLLSVIIALLAVNIKYCMFVRKQQKNMLNNQKAIQDEMVNQRSRQYETLINQRLIISKLQSNNDVFSIQGVKFYLPDVFTNLIPRHIGSTGQFYEEHRLKRIDEYLPKNGVFLDVGANIGNHTLFWMLKSNARPKRIYAFEVAHETFKILQKNIELNNLGQKVTLFDFGLSDKNINADYVNFEPNATNRTAVKQSQGGNMKLKRYDDLGINDKIAFVKIDTEGHTYEVLKGMEKMLKKDKPLIWAEVWSHQVLTDNGISNDEKKSKEHHDEILNYLASIGYEKILDLDYDNYVFAFK